MLKYNVESGYVECFIGNNNIINENENVALSNTTVEYDMNMDTDIVINEANNILKLTDSNSDYMIMIDDMVKIINNLNEVWVSNTQVETVNELMTSLNNLKMLQSGINNVANVSLKISTMRNELDDKIVKLINSL